MIMVLAASFDALGAAEADEHAVHDIYRGGRIRGGGPGGGGRGRGQVVH